MGYSHLPNIGNPKEGKWPPGFVRRIDPCRDQSLIPCIFLADPSIDPIGCWMLSLPMTSGRSPMWKPPFCQAMCPRSFEVLAPGEGL